MRLIPALLGSLLIASLSSPARAHPVAYRGSLGLMGYLSKDMTDLEVNYSVRHWFAPSLQLLRYNEGTGRPDMLLAKANFLAKRWNGPASQGNLYLHGGGGVSRLTGANRGVYHLGVTADWETRRVYVLGHTDVIRDGHGTQASYWKLRAGFAPYLAEFDRLHTWLVLEVNRKSVGSGNVEVVPTLRFFYENVLWEVGTSLSGNVHLNYIIHI